MSGSGRPDCPFCESGASERVGQWGGQMITSQWRCGACGSYFEAIREEFDDALGDQPDGARRDADGDDQAAELVAPVSPSNERK